LGNLRINLAFLIIEDPNLLEKPTFSNGLLTICIEPVIMI